LHRWQALTYIAKEVIRRHESSDHQYFLNPELADFARADSEARAFDSMSEYMRDLIRHRRQEQIEADVAFLEKAIEGAPLGDPSDDEMAEIYAGIKARRKKRHEGRL
jgi:Arc/MetJ-type ribon-helix-helix transcriptional regulator